MSLNLHCCTLTIFTCVLPIRVWRYNSYFQLRVLGVINRSHVSMHSSKTETIERQVIPLVWRHSRPTFAVLLASSCQWMQRRSQGGCWRGSSTPLSDQNIDVYFLVFHQHCTVSRDQVHSKMFFGSTTGVATHSLSNQAVMNFQDLRNIEAAFFIPACLALPYITRAGCCRALPVWKQGWHLNNQQCLLLCSLYVTKLGTS